MAYSDLPALFEYICYGSTVIINVYFFQCGDRFYTTEFDVYRRQNLTSKIVPRTENVESGFAFRRVFAVVWLQP